MKWTASVVTLMSIISVVAFNCDAKAADRVLVSRNETDEVDLDSPDLFIKPSSTSTKSAPAATSRKPASAKKEIAKELSLDDVALDEDAPPRREKKKRVVETAQRKPAKIRQPTSIDDVELDGDEPAEAPTAKKSTSASPVVTERRDEAVEKMIDAALEYEKTKDYKKVIDILQPLTDKLPRRGLTALARAGKGAGDSTVEVKTLQLSLAKNPNDYVVHTQLGEAYARLRRSEDALNSFQAAITINKKFEPAYEGLWMELERTKEYYEARSVLNDMMKLFGDKPKYYSALCRLYSFDDYLDKATEICRTATQKDPKHADNYVHLGVSLRDQEGAAEAQSLLAGAAKRFPASEPVQTTAGALFVDKKDYAVAYRYFKQATKADPTSTRAWQGLANSAFELQKHDEAVEAYGKACQIDRRMTKDLRAAIQKLRARKDSATEMKYESRLFKCE